MTVRADLAGPRWPAAASLHRRKRRRHQELAHDVGYDLAIFLGLRARGDPFLIALECGPLLLAIGKGFPGKEIGQLLVGFPNQRREEAGLLDAVLLPELQCDSIEALEQRRQTARHAAIDAHFVDHQTHSLWSCSSGWVGGSVLSQQTAPSSKADKRADRRVGKSALAPSPPNPTSIEEWWAHGACHRAAFARTRRLCPPCSRGCATPHQSRLHHRRLNEGR